MKKQLLALVGIIAIATSLQASVVTNEPIFDPKEIIGEAKSLPIEIKTPINKIVDQNFKDIQQVWFDLGKGILTAVDLNFKEIYPIVTPLDKGKLLDLEAAALKLHQTYKISAIAFEMALLALERKPLSTKSYNNLITRLVDLYNGHSSTLLGDSTANKIYKLVNTFVDKINSQAEAYNNIISGVAPKLPKATDKAQHFIAYAIGRLAIFQNQPKAITEKEQQKEQYEKTKQEQTKKAAGKRVNK